MVNLYIADGPYDVQLRCGKDNHAVQDLLNLIISKTAQNQDCSFVSTWYDADKWSLLAQTSTSQQCTPTQINTIWNAVLQQLSQSEEQEEKMLYSATNCWIYKIQNNVNYNTKQLDTVVFTLETATQDGLTAATNAIMSYVDTEKKNPTNNQCFIDSFVNIAIYSNVTHIVGNFTVSQPNGVADGCAFDVLLSNLESFVDDNEAIFDDVERFVFPLPDDKDPIDPGDDGESKDPLDPGDGDSKDPLDPGDDDSGDKHQGNSAMSQIVTLSCILATITTTAIAMM
eukprot:UN00463